ncbi:unnamed protein product [Penicillium salamii]|uniref:UDP-glucoronosyl and UDP-glucosyl transferase family protein n=1 Tax=Penicillium salamii TaxID=1612424 RepID=A0A9W4NRA9_9EURO|nr:unnamed protein product [Penicillium salamii]CAG8245106.1 unnamed protein product [Penicillium salamii]CAG8320338.1 unnamed protein product [Penicillium salamii]CAG8321196.1 unnamed protein product [Penicillium salamii]CAG8399598.1 unnamed protein product [Penicillium salamii]
MDCQNILMMTNSEYGQFNVHLAVAHELLLRLDYVVHIASFPFLESKVEDLNHNVGKDATRPSGKAIFHTIDGPSLMQVGLQCTELTGILTRKKGYGVHAAVDTYKNELPVVFTAWSPSDYLKIYDSCMRVIEEVKPDIIVLDWLFFPAVDACNVSKVKYCVLSPNSVLESIPGLRLGKPWKYPQMNSGFAYPLPWTKILPNIYLAIRLILSLAFCPRLKTLQQARHAHGIPGPNPPIGISPPTIIPSSPDTDFPCPIPPNITCCGPIIRPCHKLAENNRELSVWLARRPTVLVNMGSAVIWDTQRTAQFAEGIRVLLQRRGWIQVLWKLQTTSAMGSIEQDGSALKCLRGFVDSGQVKIMAWLPEPSSILRSGNILCMVHHGGANSFHEAIQAGVPHVVLPVWYDTYDFATRVEWLGIGVWGNKTVAPRVDGAELGAALVRAITSTDAIQFFLKAQDISEKLGEGRVIACEKIIELLSADEKDDDDELMENGD